MLLRLGAIVAFCSLGALASSYHFVFDLISHFRIQYIFLIAVVFAFALYKRKHMIASVLALCFFVHAFEVYEAVKDRNSQVKNQAVVLSIMSSNLLASNGDYDSHLTLIRSVGPDVIVFQEYTRNWHAVLYATLDEYPFRLTVPIDSPFGIAVYSKLQITSEEVVFLERQSRPSVEITVSTEKGKLKVFGTHPPPPISSNLYAERNRHLHKLAERLRDVEAPLVVVGDLNISPWSNHFSEFLNDGRLFDARRGHGILPTWPTWFLPLQIPIDHIVTGHTMRVVSIKTSSELSSDHRAIWAALAF